MNLILDAHTLIWAADNPEKLSSKVEVMLRDPKHELWVSSGTIWEIAIKVGLGKLQIDRPLLEWITLVIRNLHTRPLPIALEHAALQSQLPFHHRDPFDRLIVAQALHEGFAILSADAVLDQYQVSRIW